MTARVREDGGPAVPPAPTTAARGVCIGVALGSILWVLIIVAVMQAL